MKRKNLLTALVPLTLLFATVSAPAKDESPPNVADLWVITVDYPNEAAFEVAFKSHLAARKEAGESRNWQVYRAVAGAELNTYGVRYCCFKWADADAYAEWTQSSGILDHWNEHVAQYVDDYRHQFSILDIENSNWPEDLSGYRYYGVTSWQPKPGRTGPRQAAIKTFADVGKEHGWSRLWSWQTRVGGESSLSLVIPYTNFADMEPPEQSFYEFVAEHLGADETARIFNGFGSSFLSSEYAIFEHRRDLSMSDGED